MSFLYPNAPYKPLGPQTEERMKAHNIVCFHTMVGYLASTDPYFRTANGLGFQGTESHFGVGGKWGPDLKLGLDGKTWQWQDLMFTADANYQGNPDVISIETADNAARPIQPWTPLQVAELARLSAWLSLPSTHSGCPTTWKCHQVGIPLVLVPDTLPGRRGFGWHAQGTVGKTVPGGLVWSPNAGKDCPTAARITQIPGILARARAIVAGTPTTQLEEDIMATLDELRALLRQEIMDAPVTREGGGLEGATSLRTTLAWLDGNLSRVISGQSPAALVTALGEALKAQGVVVADLAALTADVADRLNVQPKAGE